MPDAKISELSAGSALAGTEVAPFVQSGSTVKVTAAQIRTYASAAPLALNSGTLTTSSPAVAITQTWNDSGVTFDSLRVDITDTTSQGASTLLRLRVGGSDMFSVRKDGAVTVGSWAATAIGATVGGTGQTSWTTGDILYASGSNTLAKLAAGTDTHVLTLSGGVPTWAAPTGGGGSVAPLVLGTNLVEQRNGTNAQSFMVYNTYTDASNYERGVAQWATNVLEIGTERAGTGTARDVRIKSATSTIRLKGVNNSLDLVLSDGFNSSAAYGFTYNGSSVLGIGIYGGAASANIASNLGFTTNLNSTPNTTLAYDGTAGILGMRSGTQAQTLRMYGTFTDSTNYQRVAIASASSTLSAVSGASVTATALIPDGAFLVGLTTRVTTALGTSNGTTGYQVGDGSDPDRWGAITGTAIGTTSDNRDFTVGTSDFFTADQNVVITATGGNFNGTGVIQVIAYYIRGEAD